MSNKDILLNLIENLNEDGLKFLADIFGNMYKKEIYNKNTTPERRIELQEIEAQKEFQSKEQINVNQERAAYERARAERIRQEEFKVSLTGREKRFFEVLEKVKPKNCYAMAYWELKLVADAYNNNLFDGSRDIFLYGFMKGQRAEKNKNKRVAL